MHLIEKITDRVIYGTDTEWAMNINKFDWVPGVGLMGIMKAYEVTGKSDYLNFLIHWADSYAQEAYTQKTVNSTAPLLTILNLYQLTGREMYGKVCNDIAESIINEAALTKDGGLEHTVTEDASFSEQMWADTLFMVCIFMARYGNVTKQLKYLNFAANQLKLHTHYLWDEHHQLFYHGWDGKNRDHMSGIFWARANAWIIYSTVEILNEIKAFDGRGQVLERLSLHVSGLVKCQRGDGLYSTILNDTGSYEELSASAGIAGGILRGINSGYIDCVYKETADRVCQRITDYITPFGEVMSVSGGTPIMRTAQEYKDVKRMPTLYGQALVCLALAEQL